MEGQVLAGDVPVAQAVVVVSDEGVPIGGTLTDGRGAFVLDGLPPGGRVTVRVVHPDFGAAQQVVGPEPLQEPVSLRLSVAGCFGYLDLPDPALLITPDFLESWESSALSPPCPSCATYRWFWERDGLMPVVLRLDFLEGQVLSTVRVPDGEGGWTEHTAPVKPRRTARVDRAIAWSGYWQLEHHDTSGACARGEPGSEWTVEAMASPGYRAVYRWSPLGTPLTSLGRAWLRAAGLKVRRKDFR
jgi:hypothetical protein